MSASPPEPGYVLKVRRARSQVDALADAFDTFRKDHPCYIASYYDDKKGERVWFVEGEPAEPNPEWLPLIGEVLYNLRSALDQVAYRLVESSSGKRPSRLTMYPIYTDALDFACESRTKLRGVVPEALAAVETTQPYHGGNSVALLLLNAMGNQDKHRKPNLTINSIGSGIAASHHFPDGHPIYFGPVKYGTELTRLKISREEAMHVNFGTTFDIAFGEGPGAGGIVRDLLRLMVLEVERIIEYPLAKFLA
jgi:hypothetical protein